MTLNKLPKFEMYEEESQIRISSKAVKSTIPEGYGVRNFKQDHLKSLTYVISSNDETIDHLETLYETNSLTDEKIYNTLKEMLGKFGVKLN